MTDWTAGYVAEVDYTYGYYEEMNPQRMRLAFLKAGLVAPRIKTACELGFGQGVGVNLLAGGSSIDWYGTDFNPAQASFARSLAEAGGTGARLDELSFEEYAARSDLPEFDYIALHGIWSWISDENRKLIVDLIRHQLRPGGVVYISYNTLPSWSSFVPLRNLMLQHSRRMSPPGVPMTDRIKAAVEFSKQLLESGAVYGKANPTAADRLKKIADQDPSYLAHEYFNEDWDATDFMSMTEWLEPAKLSYACSAHLHDHVNAVSLGEDAQKTLAGISDPLFREATRDMIVNQQFRRDYWVKGGTRMTAIQQTEELRNMHLMLVTAHDKVEFKIKSGGREITLNEKVYKPIVEAISDHKIVTGAELHEKVKDKGINLSQLLEALTILGGAGYISATNDEDECKAASATSAQLNGSILERSRSNQDIRFLSSPVTGGGIPVDRFQQLFLLALSQGHKAPAAWRDFAWSILSAQGQRMIKEGKVVESDEENQKALLEAAQEFKKVRLPVLKALQVA